LAERTHLTDDQRCDCWQFNGAHSRGGKREVGYPHIKLGQGLGTIRVNRLVLLLQEVPERVFVRGTEADLLLWLLRLNRQHVSQDAAHQCDAHGLGSRCVNPRHLRWEAHPDNVKSGVARKRQRESERVARAYLEGIRL
jgi:hypothetical protein